MVLIPRAVFQDYDFDDICDNKDAETMSFECFKQLVSLRV